MTDPKTKAEELFNKFYFICTEYTEEIAVSIQAKQCALILCNEMIEEVPEMLYATIDFFDYWQQVKQEVEKL